jgi:NTP pyrophosphatase (non-canonical NTP hydrolase)
MTDLAEIASRLQSDLESNRRDAITDENALLVQALCVAEEAGELAGAYRRYAGMARRKGSRDELEHEIADVLIVTAVFAFQAGIDLDKAIDDKLRIIYARGWKEEDGDAD